MPKRQQAIIWSQDGLLYRHMNVQIPNYHGEMDIISNVPAAHMQPNKVSALAPKSSIHLPLQAIYTVLLYARLKNGTYYAVAMSVRPSVRLRFPDLSSTCFEISIWILVYTFSRWHDMSSLSCITIGSFWPSLQPKVGQTHFFAIMAS